MRKGVCLILSCDADNYTKKRMTLWDSTVSLIADKMPVFYLFGDKMQHKQFIPRHTNVFKICAYDCDDSYENIPLKMYYGFRYISMVMRPDFILKIDENISINNVPIFLEIISKESEIYPYLAIKGISQHETGINYNIVRYSYCHSNKVKDTRLDLMPNTMFKLCYAGGPAYVLAASAYSVLKREYFTSNLYEDYIVGINLIREGIAVHLSAATKLINDDEDPHNEKIKPNDFMIENRGVRQVYEYILEKNRFISKPFYMHIHGGLGNQLFQLAAGLAFSIKYDRHLCLIPVVTNIRKFYWDSLLNNFTSFICSSVPTNTTKYIESAFSYKAIPENADEAWGYFQSEKYFSYFLTPDIIKKMLSVPVIKKTIPLNHILIHVRRGDYVEKAQFHGLLNNEYYTNAIKITDTNKPKIILISDSLDDVNIGDNCERILADDVETFAIMLLCSRFIIANSTYSWWGAYLAGKSVVAPRNWFGPSGPKDTIDIYPTNWIIC